MRRRPERRGSSLACLLVLSLCISGSFAQLASARHARLVVWPLRAVTPYSYDISRQTDLAALAHRSGTAFFMLAFLSAARGNVCRVSWNSRQPVGLWMQASINALRAIGGDVGVAFGGEDLARACPTARRLQDQYRLALEIYGLTQCDFDIEGNNLSSTRVNQRRNRAIAGLQREVARQGRQLTLSYTLPVGLSGLTPVEMNLLRDALRAGVTLARVNVMTMNYYTRDAPGNRMAQNAMRAAHNVVRQLHQLYPDKPPARLWGMLGLTPMIGVNNDRREVFTLQDARTLLTFARHHHLARLAFWSIQRDGRCGRGEVAPHLCSGVAQRPYQYARTFAAFATETLLHPGRGSREAEAPG